MDYPMFCGILLVFCWVSLSLAKDSPAEVQIYTRGPGHLKPNILICHAKGFYPPEIDLQLLVDGKSLPDSRLTDLAFEENWYYHLTRYANFTPEKGRQYTCKVTHKGETKTYYWDPDM